MTARLASSVLVGGLIRRAEAEGGFGTVLAKGDSTAGSILIVFNHRGQRFGTMERVLQATGDYSWQLTKSQDTENIRQIDDALMRRRGFDPDLWIVELDIPTPERFAAEMISSN